MHNSCFHFCNFTSRIKCRCVMRNDFCILHNVCECQFYLLHEILYVCKSSYISRYSFIDLSNIFTTNLANTLLFKAIAKCLRFMNVLYMGNICLSYIIIINNFQLKFKEGKYILFFKPILFLFSIYMTYFLEND